MVHVEVMQDVCVGVKEIPTKGPARKALHHFQAFSELVGISKQVNKRELTHALVFRASVASVVVSSLP